MFARLKIILFLTLMSLSPTMAEARVHRRNVGPIILDLGSLPPPPVPEELAQPSVNPGNVPFQSPAEASPVSVKSAPDPATVGVSYPVYPQLPGALVLTLPALSEPAPEQKSVIIAPLIAPQVPVLIAYLNPMLDRDYALFNAAADRSPQPAALPKPPEGKSFAGSGFHPGTAPASVLLDAPPPSRLRALVVWIWRFLFVIGLGVLISIYLRRRAVAKNPVSLSPIGATPEPETSQELILSRISRATGATRSSVADSLSLITENPRAIAMPQAGTKGFGLIEPGAARPLTTLAGQDRDQTRQQRQAPL